MNGIVLAYAGVHQIFQLAAAAQMIGELEALHCSLVSAPGKWGRLAARLADFPSTRGAGHELIPADKIREHPLSFLAQKLASKLLPWGQVGFYRSNGWFDKCMAGQIYHSQARIFVGAETCAEHSMAAAEKRGMINVLDCHGIPSWFLHENLLKASADFRLPPPKHPDTPEMAERKLRELSLAKVILVCSDLQKRLLVTRGIKGDAIQVNPLWVDSTFWSPSPKMPAREKKPLKVLYAGSISLAKGVPYLFAAMKKLGNAASLTLVGGVTEEIRCLFENELQKHTVLPYSPPEVLRKLMREHDVLVMPSLGDSFGFVSMQAMACGLPVIVTENCGAPVPHESWRVPPHDAEAVATRLEHYLGDRSALQQDSTLAVDFVQPFTPDAFRHRAAALFQILLLASS